MVKTVMVYLCDASNVGVYHVIPICSTPTVLAVSSEKEGESDDDCLCVIKPGRKKICHGKNCPQYIAIG